MAFDLSSAQPIEDKELAPKRPKFDLSSAQPVEVAKPAPKQKKSMAESAVRGFSQGGTFGFGDEIQAALRALSPVQLEPTTIGGVTVPSLGWNQDFGEYSALRDEQRGENKQAVKDNPGSYLAGSLASALPAGGAAGVGKTVITHAGRPTAFGVAAENAFMGGVQGLGAGEGDFGDQALSTLTGAGIQGAAGKAGDLINAGAKALPTIARDVIANPKGRMALQTAGLAGAGAIGATAMGGDPLAGAVIGAGTNFSPRLREFVGNQISSKIGLPIVNKGTIDRGIDAAETKLNNVINISRNRPQRPNEVIGNTVASYPGQYTTTSNASKLAAGAPSSLVMALRQMSGQDAEKIVANVEPAIQQKIDQGTPSYAARFSALQNSPEYRVAHQKVADEAEEDDDSVFED